MVQKFVHWNCRSIQSNGHWLRTPHFQEFPVLCLQETFLKKDIAFTLPSMQIYRADRAEHGGGLITAVHSSIASYNFPLPPPPSKDTEALGVRIWFRHAWLTIINIYLPHGKFCPAWFNDLLASIQGPYLIMGDFNINLLHSEPPLPHNLKLFQDWLLENQICVLNTDSPTRLNIKNSSYSLLDLSLCSPDLSNCFTYSIHPDPFDSDHQPVIISYCDVKISINTPTLRSAVHWVKAGSHLNSLLDDSDNLDYNTFMNSCKQAIDFNHIKNANHKYSSAPWWDNHCRKLLAQKRRLLRLARSLCSQEYWIQYKHTSSKLRRYIKTNSRRYWDHVCRKTSNGSGIFKILKRLALRDSPNSDNIIIHNGPIATPSEQAKIFLLSFQSDDPGPPLPYDMSGSEDYFNVPFSINEIKHAIKKTKPTTPGADGISVKLLKHLSSKNLESLCNLFNDMLKNSSVPQSWKIATVIPVKKPGKPSHLTSSYRPIALTSVCAKVFERIILHRLVLWAGRNKIFHPYHFGFMPFRDCTTALCTFYKDIHSARSSGRFVSAVCLDIKAAYDSVWIDGLIYKLSEKGIRGNIGNWIASFISHRYFNIKWKSTITSLAPSLRGVPQGSVLSPFLFMIYMHDVFEVLDSNTRIVLFADDLIVYSIGDDSSLVFRSLQNTIDRIVLWCDAMMLSISPDKCSAINFSRSRKPWPLIHIKGCSVKWDVNVKILGVWFSYNLSFKHHFTYLRGKALKRINYLRAIANCSRGVCSSHMLRIVNSLIRSLLEYACPVFGSSCASDINSLEPVYNAAIRIATGLPKFTPIPVLRREALVSSVASRFIFLTKRFAIRQLSHPLGSPFGDSLYSLLANNQNCNSIANHCKIFLDHYNLQSKSILRFTWPINHLLSPLDIISSGLPFQNSDLPPSAIQAEFRHWIHNQMIHTLIATDASKDNVKTSIAAVDISRNLKYAALIPHSNSVFTAEALAIYAACSFLIADPNNYIIISDSLSVLQALDHINIHSPKIIITLYNLIQSMSAKNIRITFVWVPGHKGIEPNEKADELARLGPFAIATLNIISPEDLLAQTRIDWEAEKEYAWISSDYYHSYTHLSTNRNYSIYTSSRRLDVLIARWRARALLTNSRLYKMKMHNSSLCPHCMVDDTPDHILLECSRSGPHRPPLLHALNLSPPVTYSEVLSQINTRKTVRAFETFSTAVLS